MKIKVSVMKFEMVNGKKVGKSLEFGLDVEKMAELGTRERVKKYVEKYAVRSKVFKVDEKEELKYDMKHFWEEWKKEVKRKEEKMMAA